MNSVERKHNPLRVLLIEDSEDDAALVLRELHRGGYDVNCRRVETAHDMRAMLSKETWDIVLSDYSLPEFDALRALDVLHASGIDLPFIIVSGTIGEETAVAALHAGAQDFLVKGKLARLVPAVARGLSARAIREARRQSEIALRASETRYRRMVETMNEGMWLVDADAKTTFVNRRMTTMLGYEVEEMLGRSISSSCTKSRAPPSPRALRARAKGSSRPRSTSRASCSAICGRWLAPPPSSTPKGATKGPSR